MINYYAKNDDDYYNRPPIGKPKVKRIKRNTNTNINPKNSFKSNIYENMSNNYEETTKKISSSDIRKRNNDYQENNNYNENLNDDDDNYEINNDNNN